MSTTPIGGHAGRPTTRASQRRFLNRLSSNLNAALSDTRNPTGNAAGAHAVNVTANSGQLLSSTPTVISWFGTTVDTDSWWSAGNASRITVTYTGIYSISGLVTPLYGGSSASGSWLLEVLKNGSAVHSAQGFFDMTATITTCLVVSTVLLVGVGEYLELRMSENSGTSFFADSSNTEFTVALIGTT